jgi:charged multivesicular body protein 4
MWGRLFGGGTVKRDDTRKAIVNMREMIDTLTKREKHLQKQIEEQENLARKYVSKNKEQARQALKRKKVHEGNLDKIQGQIASLEGQLTALENANLNLETMKVMTQGAQAMKSIHGNMNIDKVDATMDDIRDQIALNEEISNAISQPFANEVDEDELNEEL